MNADDIELDKEQKWPLHSAARNGKIPTLTQLLLTNKADINAKDDLGYTAFDYAMISERYPTAQFLLEQGAAATIGDINILLGCALRLKNFIKIQMLVEKHKGDPNVKDALGWTLLHLAVYQGEIELVRCLLNDRRTNVNAVTDKKMTPYDFAQQQLKAALAYRNPDSKSTPLFTEERKQHHGKIIELFKKREAKLGALTVMWAQKKQCSVFSRMPRDVALIIAGMVMRK